MIAAVLTAAMSISLGAAGVSAADNSVSGFEPALDTETEATLYFLGNYGNFEALDQVALDFKNYYPNVDVIYTKLDDYRNDIANRFVTGEEIDLFMCSWWDEAFPGNGNIIENAEDLGTTGIDFSNLNPDMLSLGAVDETQLMVPLYVDCCGYMVNLDLFEAAGAEVPTNSEELLTACEKLAAAGYEKPIYIRSGAYGRSFTGTYMEQRLGGSDETAALEETIAKMDELYASGYVNDEGNTLEDAYNAMILRFFEGDIPLEPIIVSNYSGTKKREAKSEAFTANPFNYAFIPAFYGETSDRTYINELGSVYVGVYKGSEQLEMANEFLRFMLTDDEMYTFQTIKNMPTANVTNGMDTFPYLKEADLYYSTEEGISSLDEEYAMDVLNEYDAGGDHAGMYEMLNGFLENGLG